MILSPDVIYHLPKDSVFSEDVERIFCPSEIFVGTYSSNTDFPIKEQAPHFRHRNFTEWICENEPWELFGHSPNKYPLTIDSMKGSFSDFYIYKKIHEK